MNHDLIIVGGGAGGLGAARAARWAGADVLLVNEGPIGGDCTFTGCVPSKTLLAAAAQDLEFGAAMARVGSTVERIAATETADVLRAEGIGVREGRGRLATHDTVVVDADRITAPRIIVATGSRPVVPAIPGLDEVDPDRVLTNESVFSLADAPATLGIVGGGPIGCELAQAFAWLGVEVTLFEGLPRLLSREEPEAGAAVARALAAAGVDVRSGTMIDAVETRPDGVAVVSGGAEVVVERLLLAVGRAPNSGGLGLEELGVELDPQGHVVTDDRLATDVRGVYAVGDVTGKLSFTHAADEMGRLAAGNALRRGVRGRFRTSWIPWVTFTQPEVARIGMTEAEASRHGGRVAELPLAEMDRALTDGHTEGYIKLIAGPKRLTRRVAGGRMIGATIVAPRAGEMIHEIALAMRTNAFTGRLAQTVHAYPTWSYGIQKAAAQFFGEVEGRTARPAASDESR
ncbi:MAG: FAD-dependent oxidoreductase [Acidimicrobiales bacterium]|nr:FAD-dependent oxidoreductase [Acidimicrobiales bacterium]